ncbi:MAG: TRAP transporter substrate-binding protein DctP [Acidimicrobiia bacterium]
MDRREFLKTAGFGAAGLAGAALLAACQTEGGTVATTGGTTGGTGGAATTGNPDLDTALQAEDLPEVNWNLATSWPTNLDTIFGGATTFADRVSAMTNGRFTIDARAGGELVPPLEVLQSVQQGAVDAGHTASYYYLGLGQWLAFGTALPFGLTARQQNAWLYYGGGLDMLQQLYADKFNVIQFPAGNTGVQMGGWFNKEIKSLADIQGLRFRIPGLGGSVMDKLGAAVQVIAGGEIFQSLQTGAIDAAEWVGPYDDTKLEFQTVAKYYYYPGWWEPGPTLEVQIGLDKWNALPEEYQEVVKSAAAHANVDMMASYDAKNPVAFNDLVNGSDVQVLPFPDDVMQAAEAAAFEIYDQNASDDPDFKSVFDAWKPFRDSANAWFKIAEGGMINYQPQV